MALADNTRRTFPINGPMTVADLTALAAQLDDEDIPGDYEVRVLTRVGFSRDGAQVRQVNIVPPTRPANGAPA